MMDYFKDFKNEETISVESEDDDDSPEKSGAND